MDDGSQDDSSETPPSMRVSRRKLLALTGASLAGGLAGCPSDSSELGTATSGATAGPTATGDLTPTAEPDHTITATPGDASIGLSGGQVGTVETHTLTLTIPNGLDGRTLTEVRVEYDDGFDLSRIDLADVTVTIGSQQGEATEIDISDVTVSDDARTITITLGGSVTLAAGEIVVTEYDGVELPSLAGEYLVTAVLNGEASETGAITITESTGEVGSTFDKGIDGWRIEGDAQGGSALPNYEETGGNPGGHISAIDDVQGGVWYFVAPANFRGDKSEFYGGTITFDLIQNRTDSQFSSDDIKLSGGGIDLVYDFGDADTHPRTDWTAYSATLEESDDWIVDGTGEQATAEQIQTVLADVTRLHVRGEYVSGSDTGYLDNPTLWPPDGDPPPADYDATPTPSS
jgi:hypothetical protein